MSYIIVHYFSQYNIALNNVLLRSKIEDWMKRMEKCNKYNLFSIIDFGKDVTEGNIVNVTS